MGSAEPRAELRRLLESTVGGLLMEGLGWDEVVEVVRRRLTGSEPAEAGRPAGAPLVVPESADLAWYDDGERRMLQRGEWPPRLAKAGPTPAVETPAASPVSVRDDAGEPPVGSVVTDSRSRVCWRDESGWRRAGVEQPMTWGQVCAAVGGPEQQPMPGTPTVVSQPPVRAQGPMVLRPAGSLDLPMQRPVLGPDGEPLVGANGQKVLQTENETITISEIVPAGGQP